MLTVASHPREVIYAGKFDYACGGLWKQFGRKACPARPGYDERRSVPTGSTIRIQCGMRGCAGSSDATERFNPSICADEVPRFKSRRFKINQKRRKSSPIP